MRLIHYGAKPLTKVHSNFRESGAYKPTGLWVSVEGPHDWLEWCKGESFRLDCFAAATEVVLKKDANVLHIKTLKQFDAFEKKYHKVLFELPGGRSHYGIDWGKVKQDYDGLIIAPYQWKRRLNTGSTWYYGWDAASGVIWNPDVVAELKPLDPPKIEEHHLKESLKTQERIKRMTELVKKNPNPPHEEITKVLIDPLEELDITKQAEGINANEQEVTN